MTGAADAIIKFLRLTFLRPVERFLAQWLSVSTEPTAFVRERIRLGDTTNFLRAVGFFFSAISTAFLAELATLYLLGIGNTAEPYYWLVIVLTSIPFVLFCFLLIRLVAPLSPKDVLHLSLYPIGAGVFAGALFALVASGVVALLLAVGFIPEIKYDFTQWGQAEQVVAVNKQVLRDCLQQGSLIYTVLAAGLQGAYENLKPPIDDISFIRPVTTLFYLIIAALIFMAAVDRRKSAVFGVVLLAALFATAANVLSLKAFFDWNFQNSGCEKNLAERGLDRMAESALKNFAAGLDHYNGDNWDVSYRAEGRVLFHLWRSKRPVVDMAAFRSAVDQIQKDALTRHCSDSSWTLRSMKATETEIFYSVNGERLTSFSIGPADCAKW